MTDRVALYLPSLRGGGAERVMVTLANSFAGCGLLVDLVLASGMGEYVSEISPNVRLVDLRARRVLTSLPALACYLRRERPSALVSAMGHANVVAIWARALSGIATRVVVTEHFILSDVLRHATRRRVRVMAWAMRASYAWADEVVAVSKGAAVDLARTIGHPIERIHVIYNPIDLRYIGQQARAPLDHPWFASREPPVILSVGRLAPEKDFQSVLRAFALLRETHTARLMILGEGALRAELETLARQLGIEPDFSMPGFVANPFSYMARARLFALSSRSEALSSVIIEALACGCPVVSTNCPSAPAEILEDGKWGRLTPIGDIEALAGAMAATLDEPVHPDTTTRAADFGLDRAVNSYLQVLFPNATSGAGG